MVVSDFVGFKELFVGVVSLILEFQGDFVALGEVPAKKRLESAFDVDVEFNLGQ